jgi:hypothetical protein
MSTIIRLLIFPIESSTKKLVGSVAMYCKESCEPTPCDHDLAALGDDHA